MLRHEFFHRARKVVITDDELNRTKNLKKKLKDRKDSTEKKKNDDKISNLTGSCKDIEQKHRVEGSNDEIKKELKKKSKVR